MSVSLKPQNTLQSSASEVPNLANSAQDQLTITQLQKENLLLTKAVTIYLREAEVARDQLQKFASRVSHDLKAPLRHIASYLTIIKEDFLNERVEGGTLKYMENVCNSSINMGKMIDGLRELTKAEEQEVQLTGVDLGREISFVVKQISQKYPGTSFFLPELPVIQADLAMVRTIFIELLDNAAKFSSKGVDGRVAVACQQSDGYWEISVADNGVGFDDQGSYMLFEIFERCASARDFDGLGIGLSIVSRLAKSLKGEVTGKGVLDEGAVFTVRLKA